MKPTAKLKAVKELQKSTGWQVMVEVMRDEILASAMSIADSAKMDVDEINFRRGSIWAAKQLMDMPIRLQVRLESEAALDAVDDNKKSTDQ